MPPCPPPASPADENHPTPAASGCLKAATARAAMVARLEADRQVHDPQVRAALLAVRREVLLPQAYVRRNAPGTRPGVWQLLDGTHPEDRAEWLEVIHSGGSVLVQHDGEDLNGRGRGTVTGGAITGLSSVVSMTVHTLQRLELRPGARLLELGTGTGITAALAAHILGPDAVVTVESDPHLVAAARRRLAEHGLSVRVVAGDGLTGCADDGPYDRILSTFAVPSVPPAWLEQLADDGRLLTTIATASPSWPGECLVRRTGNGFEAVLEGRERGHRPVNGHRWLSVLDHRHLANRQPARRRTTEVAPQGADVHGFWLAVSHLAPGVVRDFAADHLTLIAPDDASWARILPEGPGIWRVEEDGEREIWTEVEEIHRRWAHAGRPTTYRLEFSGSRQYAHAGHGTTTIGWELPAGPGPSTPQDRGRA